MGPVILLKNLMISMPGSIIQIYVSVNKSKFKRSRCKVNAACTSVEIGAESWLARYLEEHLQLVWAWLTRSTNKLAYGVVNSITLII